MSRWFNIAGPCQADIHYMLSATARLPDLEQIIEQRSYFVIHAPRQTGKTTAMLALAKQLTESGRYTAVMVSAEVGSAFNHDVGVAEVAMLETWRDTIAVRLPKDLQPPAWSYSAPGQRIRASLQVWAQASSRPLVLFIDEIDSLQDEALISCPVNDLLYEPSPRPLGSPLPCLGEGTGARAGYRNCLYGHDMISVLRQLRDGYPNRPNNFPLSVGLIGLRDVRDYKVASGGSDRLNTSSPFNIKVSSLTLRNFNAEEVQELYQQHTDDTGQVFTPDSVATAFDLT